MKPQVELEPSYLLHSKKYTDSKILSSFLTLNHGVIQSVVRVIKKKKLSQPPQAFTPTSISWLDATNLKTIVLYEQSGPRHILEGRSLYCALYLNEIILRIYSEQHEADGVFDCYQQALTELAVSCLEFKMCEFNKCEFKEPVSKEHNSSLHPSNLHQSKVHESILRAFELNMLDALGFAMNFSEDVNEVPIINNRTTIYRFRADSGFTFYSSSLIETLGIDSFYGADIVSIKQRNWNSTSLSAAKRLLRLALAPHLGSKPIRTRELFS